MGRTEDRGLGTKGGEKMQVDLANRPGVGWVGNMMALSGETHAKCHGRMSRIEFNFVKVCLIARYRVV